jgi:antitoxin ParD1/3/4
MPSSVDLGKKLEFVVSKLVSGGRYNSRSEVLREGVRLVQERERRLESLDRALDRGLADADAGRVTPIEEVAVRLKTKVRAMAADKRK